MITVSARLILTAFNSSSYGWMDKVSISARSNVTSEISLHEACVRVGGSKLSHNQISNFSNG